MHQLWSWITANAAPITAIATVLYLIATLLIFNEARKSADAAKESAEASKTSADAAQKSIALMRQDLDEKEALGTFSVGLVIQDCLEAIDAILEMPPLQNAKVGEALIRIENLLREQAEAAVTHAARKSPDAANHLSSAFHSLRMVPSYIKALDASGYAPNNPAHARLAKPAMQALEDSRTHLHAAEAAFPSAPTKPAAT